jgi:flagellar biogenesis protein FliO
MGRRRSSEDPARAGTHGMTPTTARRSSSPDSIITALAAVGLTLLAGSAVLAAPPVAGSAPGITPARANAQLSVARPASPDDAVNAVVAPAASAAAASTSASALDPVAERVREHGARPLGGTSPAGVLDGLDEASAGATGDESPAATAALPVAGEGILGGSGELLRVGAALGIVLAIALLLSRTVRRLNGATRPGRPAGVLEVLARYPVGRGQHIAVLRLDRRLLLVHHAGTRMEPLTEISHPDEVASLIGRLEAGASGGDAERFRRTLAEFEHGRGPEGLRPDGTFAAETSRRRFGLGGRSGGSHAPEPDAERDARASGLAAAIRAGRRRAAYGAAHAAAAAGPEAAMPEVEIVDLTRNGIRGGRR